jgi:hypothetical protein
VGEKVPSETFKKIGIRYNFSLDEVRKIDVPPSAVAVIIQPRAKNQVGSYGEEDTVKGTDV